MYEFLIYLMAGIQFSVFLIVTPFIIRQFVRRTKIENQCMIMWYRCEELVDTMWRRKNEICDYMNDLQLDFQALNVWIEDPARRLKLYTAFIDKWEARIAAGEILKPGK